MHPGAYAERRGLSPQTLAPGAVAYQQQTQVWVPLKQCGGDVEQIIVSFERKKPCDHTQHAIVVAKTQSSSSLRIRLDGQEGFERKATEDTGVLSGPADAGREVLISHGVGDHHKVFSVTSRQTFGRLEETVGKPPLKGSKGGSMNGV
jgi:hypothetical protein